MRKSLLSFVMLLAVPGLVMAGPSRGKYVRPADAKSKAFAAALVALKITNFTPARRGPFVYTQMRFADDDTWTGNGYVEIEDERMECVESGSWSMEPADSATVAVVAWKVDSTDCTGRTAGGETRAEFTIANSRLDAVFR